MKLVRLDMPVRAQRSLPSLILAVLLLPISSKSIDQSGESSPTENEKTAGIPNNTICHLGHSAILLKIGGKVFIFDYPYGTRALADQIHPLQPEELRQETVYAFFSHRHGDHHNSGIFSWRNHIPRLQYIVSSDITRIPAGLQVTRLPPGKLILLDGMKVRSYRSSDAGIAFSIYVAGKHIYFSGDNGFWKQSKGMTEEDHLLQYLASIDRSVPMDIAFQVCDERLFEMGRGYGGTEIFARTFQPTLLVPIHLHGRYEFLEQRKQQLKECGFYNHFWVVKKQGDSMSFDSLGSEASVQRPPKTLHQAAAAGNVSEMKKLLVAGASASEKNDDGRTPLHLAVGLGSLEAVEMLLSQGAQGAARDKNGWTPLQIAAGANRLSMVELLVNRGADLEAKDANGRSPLNVAVEVGSQAMVEFLITAGADVHTTDKYLRTPLQFAAEMGDRALAKLLIAKGAKLESKDNQGASPLYRAVTEGQIEIVGLLIEAGADVNGKTKSGRIPLHTAVLDGRLDLIEVLLDQGSKVNVKDRMGYSPLKLARAGNHREIIDLLKKHGAKETIEE